MMIRKRMILLALLIAGLLSAAVRHSLPTWKQRLADLRNRSHAVDATRFHTYLIRRSTWIEFQIPPQASALRVFTNAALSATDQTKPFFDLTNPRPGYRYCLEYQLLDEQGKPLRASRYHFRGSLLQYRDTASNEVFSPSFFESSKLTPTSTRTMQLPLTPYDQVAARIRLRLIDHEPAVAEVVARVFCRIKRAGYDDPTTWQRLSDKTRDKLARVSVYSHEQLTPFERQNLLRWRWVAASPIGLEQRDYHSRTLFVLVDDDDETYREMETAPVVDVHPRQRLVIPLPNESGTAVVRLSPPDDTDPPPGTSTIRWYGQTIQDRSESHYAIPCAPIPISPPHGGGLLEVATDVPVTAEIFWKCDNAEEAEPSEDITPAPRSVRMFESLPGEPIEYSMSFVDDQPTPFQAVFRTPVPPHQELASPTTVTWQYLDDQGAILQHGELALERSVSLYDQLYLSRNYLSVTNPADYYFAVPFGVAKIRFMADQSPVLVTAYTRPPGAPKRTLVPDDYLPINQVATTRRGWFILRPDDYERRVNQNRSVSCRIQLRPPEDHPHLRDGDYDWQDFLPRGRVASREILTPRPSSVPVREQALAATFVEVSPSRTPTASWIRPPDRRWITPRLIYQVGEKGNEDPIVRILIDGQEYFRQQLQSINGELDLPPVASNETGQTKTFQFQTTADVRLFVNYLNIPGATYFLKRLTHRLQGQMEFAYRKQSSDPELLLLRVFQPLAVDRGEAPMKIRTRLEPSRAASPTTNGPTQSYSITNRIYEIAPPNTAKTIVLGAGRQTIDDGETCFLSVGEDLPAGDYTIHVETDRDGYVMIYRSLPGLAPQRSLFLEDDDNE